MAERLLPSRGALDRGGEEPGTHRQLPARSPEGPPKTGRPDLRSARCASQQARAAPRSVVRRPHPAFHRSAWRARRDIPRDFRLPVFSRRRLVAIDKQRHRRACGSGVATARDRVASLVRPEAPSSNGHRLDARPPASAVAQKRSILTRAQDDAALSMDSVPRGRRGRFPTDARVTLRSPSVSCAGRQRAFRFRPAARSPDHLPARRPRGRILASDRLHRPHPQIRVHLAHLKHLWRRQTATSTEQAPSRRTTRMFCSGDARVLSPLDRRAPCGSSRAAASLAAFIGKGFDVTPYYLVIFVFDATLMHSTRLIARSRRVRAAMSVSSPSDRDARS